MVCKTLETCHRYLKHDIFNCSFIFFLKKTAQKVFSSFAAAVLIVFHTKSLDFADFELDMIRISRSSLSFCYKKLNLFFRIWQSIEVICKI